MPAGAAGSSSRSQWRYCGLGSGNARRNGGIRGAGPAALTAILAAAFFLVNGWARNNLFQMPDGVSIRPAWWLVTLATSGVMILVSRPRITAGALTLSASLFGATHVTPTGPLGAACFLVAALYIELVVRKGQKQRPAVATT